MIKNENIFLKKILYVVRLEPTISTLTAIRSIQMAKRDSDGYRKILHSEINTFHNVCKSKISFTELYEFIRHIHECQFNFVYLYHMIQSITIHPVTHGQHQIRTVILFCKYTVLYIFHRKCGLVLKGHSEVLFIFFI